MFLRISSISETIIAMILTSSVISKADTIVIAVSSGAVAGVTIAIMDRNIVVVAIEFGKLLFRRYQGAAPTISCHPTVGGAAATTTILQRGGHVVRMRWGVSRSVLMQWYQRWPY